MPDFSGRANNFLIAHRNWVDETTTTLTSPTTFVSTLPLTNLKDDRLSKVARSTTNSMVLNLDFGRTVPITLIALLGHNFTESAKWRIRFASDPAFSLTTTVYDSRPILDTSATSPTSLTINGSSKSFVVSNNVFFFNNAGIRISSASNPTGLYMDGDVSSYDSRTRIVTMNVQSFVGSGTYSDWQITRLNDDIDVWPEVQPFGTGGYWGEFTWGGLIDLLGADYDPPAIHLPMLYQTNNTTGEPVSARYCRIEVTDPTLSYVQAGRLFVAPAYQPSLNILFDWNIEFIDPSVRTRSRGGQFFVDPRRKYRRLNVALSDIPRDEIFGELYELDRKMGVSRPVLAIIDPVDPIHLHRFTVYGSMPNTTPINNPYHDAFSKQITVEEWL